MSQVLRAQSGGVTSGKTRQTEVAKTDTPRLFQAAVQEARRLLCNGEVVAVPTETVYGLAANALNPDAVAQIFAIKARPSNNPLIVHVADESMGAACVSAWPSEAQALARAFWPGPLTIVLRRAGSIPDVVTAGGDTVGIRLPSHPFTQELIRACGFPLAAPSANPSNRISPTCAGHVLDYFGGQLALIVDGGHSSVGIESTVLDLTQDPPRILRPGMVHGESIEAVLRKPVATGAQTEEATVLRSPGQLRKHYAPRARLHLAEWASPERVEELARELGPRESVHVLAHTHVPHAESAAQVSVIPRDAQAFARAIYAEMHRCDSLGAEHIIVETPPDEPEWHAIHDRLRRAAAR